MIEMNYSFQCKIFRLTLFFTILSQCGNSQSLQQYPDNFPPTNLEPKVFASGSVSVNKKNSHAVIFSPDGETLIFSRYPDRTSYMMVFANGKWSKPTEAPFFGKEVTFSPDGDKIYYYTDGDIFYVEKYASGCSKPVKVSSEINSDEQVEYYPCIVKSGAMYFSRNSNWKEARLMYSEYKNKQFTKAIDLGQGWNDGGASHAWIAPDESYMLFNSPREDSFTRNDIWISFRNSDNTWGKPKNLGATINSGADAVLCPTVSPDGKYLFFTKFNFEAEGNEHTGLVYWVSTEIFEQLMTDNR